MARACGCQHLPCLRLPAHPLASPRSYHEAPTRSALRTPKHHPTWLQMFYKHARVEYVPVGVVGAIVPWNYPFHNIFNPLTAALFAGNAIVIKASASGWLCLHARERLGCIF